MNTDAFTTAARAEAEERYEFMSDMACFEEGVEWARDHLARQEVTDAEVEAAAIMLCASAHQERVWEALAKVDPVKRDRLRVDARAALAAAKEARA